jgi:uncharacterized membrane protein
MTPASQRLRYLDWVRGLAAITMLQGHVFDSFLRTDLHETGAFTMSQFAGGMPPAVFLFLLGVTFAFLMDSQERKGVAPAARWRACVKRSGYLFAVAFLFRLQLWVFSTGQSPWTDLLRVDVLNCMGFSLFVLAAMAFFRTNERTRLCAILGIAIASASPVISGLESLGMPVLVRNYLLPDHLFFGFFPWAAYVAFGMSVGSVLRLAREAEVSTVMQWFAWGGLALAFSAYTISGMGPSIYTKSDFWLNSPALVFIKVGVVLMLIAFAWVWNLQVSERSWSWVRQFGVSSLLIYWVHVELIYGRALGALKGFLTVPQTVLAAVLTILLMLGLSVLWTNRAGVRAWLSPQPGRVEDRVSGD